MILRPYRPPNPNSEIPMNWWRHQSSCHVMLKCSSRTLHGHSLSHYWECEPTILHDLRIIAKDYKNSTLGFGGFTYEFSFLSSTYIPALLMITFWIPYRLTYTCNEQKKTIFQVSILADWLKLALTWFILTQKAFADSLLRYLTCLELVHYS